MTFQRMCAKCGGPNDRTSRPGTRQQSYCRSCHAARMRATRPRHSELPDIARRKAITRSYTNVLVRRGHLVKKLCERCGSAESQAHHPDYSNPRLVEWLCRPCHEEHHRSAA